MSGFCSTCVKGGVKLDHWGGGKADQRSCESDKPPCHLAHAKSSPRRCRFHRASHFPFCSATSAAKRNEAYFTWIGLGVKATGAGRAPAPVRQVEKFSGP